MRQCLASTTLITSGFSFDESSPAPCVAGLMSKALIGEKVDDNIKNSNRMNTTSISEVSPIAERLRAVVARDNIGIAVTQDIALG